MESETESLRMHTLVKVIDVEPNQQYPGKFIATLHIDGVTFSTGWKFYISEKQYKSLLRVHKKVPVACVLRHVPGKGHRFVFASDNAAWLKQTFIDSPRAYTPEPKSEPKPAPKQEELIGFDDLPF